MNEFDENTQSKDSEPSLNSEVASLWTRRHGTNLDRARSNEGSALSLDFGTDSIYKSPETTMKPVEKPFTGDLIDLRQERTNSEFPPEYTQIPGRDGIVTLRDRSGLVVELLSGSPEFQQRMLRELQNIPLEDRRLLAQGRVRIVIAERISNVDPALATQRPRQWGRGNTWDDVDGAHLVERNLIVIAETTRSGPTARPLGVLRHEIGHALDDLLGNLSQTREFREALLRDIQRMNRQQRLFHRYRLHAEEALADLYAVLRGGAPNAEETNAIADHFPNTLELLRQRLANRPIGRVVRRPA